MVNRMMKIVALLTLVIVCEISIGCAGPIVVLSTMHPAVGDTLVVTASGKDIRCKVRSMEIKTEGTSSARSNGNAVELSMYLPPGLWCSNREIKFKAIARTNFFRRRTRMLRYVVDPLRPIGSVDRDYTPHGSWYDLPVDVEEWNGENLYSIDSPLLRMEASVAVTSFIDAVLKDPTLSTCSSYIEYLRDLTDPDVPLIEVLPLRPDPADFLVEAVSYWVRINMDYCVESQNREIFKEQGLGSYPPVAEPSGSDEMADFPQPANITVLLSEYPEQWSNYPDPDNSYMNEFGSTGLFTGDCEDFAILRNALLYELGFAPWSLWNVIDNPIDTTPVRRHEYSIVIYQGAFRVLDTEQPQFYLNPPPHARLKTTWGWNLINGIRTGSAENYNFLWKNVYNYYRLKGESDNWSWRVYYEDIKP